MNTSIFLGLLGIWFISAVFDYAHYLYFIQLKEYRWDRFQTFLQTKQGQDFMISYRIFYRHAILIICYLFLSPVARLSWILAGYFIVDLLYNIYLIRIKKVYRPTLTKRALLIFVAALAFEGLAIYAFWQIHATVLLVIIFRLFVVGGISLGVSMASFTYRLTLRKKASYKIAQLKKDQGLKVIAITGSYGKTSTKEILSQLLAKRFQVITIPRNLNTDYSISSFILNSDFSKADLFIVEIGAYNKGDVAFSCDIVLPDIGILTTIGPEHLSLFGSMDNIRKTKFELLEALPADGLGITNTDNDYIRPHIEEITNVPVKTFGIDEDFDPDCLITHMNGKATGTDFHVQCEGKPYDLSTKVIGEHNVKNIVPSMMVALHLGMTKAQVTAAVEDLVPISRLLIKEYGQATILNDSYNSNPEGFKAALNLLSSYPSDKERIVITRGMLELGDQSEEQHEKIAGEISFAADRLVLINKDFEAPIRKGLVKKYGIKLDVITDQKELLSFIKSLKQKNVVILIENRLPPKIYKFLRQHSRVSTDK